MEYFRYRVSTCDMDDDYDNQVEMSVSESSSDAENVNNNNNNRNSDATTSRRSIRSKLPAATKRPRSRDENTGPSKRQKLAPIKRTATQRGATHSSSQDSFESDAQDDHDDFDFDGEMARIFQGMSMSDNETSVWKNFLPQNLSVDDVKTSVKTQVQGHTLRSVNKPATSSMDTFDMIGGLQEVISSLRETISVPLRCSAFYTKFQIKPTKGVIFYGPPGVGKTTVARGLANYCKQCTAKKVAFFLRNGSDVLNSYAGQSEANLRILFNMAQLLKPSIIFFDEIDALVPHRSAHQDNRVETSVVSTLLSLMDGLEDRGLVFVIGATNRLEAIDPALRRPGRFDMEIYFPTPNLKARTEILTKMTSTWNIDQGITDRIARQCYNFNGADLAALCNTAALNGLKDANQNIRFDDPQDSSIPIKISKVKVTRENFEDALKKVLPTRRRSASLLGEPLREEVEPLLKPIVDEIVATLQDILPVDFTQNQTTCLPFVSRRFLLSYDKTDMVEQMSMVSKAILHSYEGAEVFEISTLKLRMGDPSQMLEVISRADKVCCGVIVIPNINELFLDQNSCTTDFLQKLCDIGGPSQSVLVFATSTVPTIELPTEMQKLDFKHCALRPPTEIEKKAFYRNLFENACPTGPSTSAPTDAQLTKYVNQATRSSDNRFCGIYKKYVELQNTFTKHGQQGWNATLIAEIENSF